MKKYIEITADTNDADYISSLTEISDEEIDIILPVIKAIKEFKPYTVHLIDRTLIHNHNFSFGEYVRDDLGEKAPHELYTDGINVTGDMIEAFIELVPFGEHGIHTIKDVRIYHVEKIDVLL